LYSSDMATEQRPTSRNTTFDDTHFDGSCVVVVVEQKLERMMQKHSP
jgi:hypothetical protein